MREKEMEFINKENNSDETVNYKGKPKFFQQFFMEYKYLVISVVIGMLNVVLCRNLYGALGLIIFEIFVLLYFFIKKKYIDYAMYYLMFVTFSMEFDYYLDAEIFYSLKNWRIFGVNLATIFLLPIFFLAIHNFKHFKRGLKKIKYLNKFFKLMIFLSSSATFMGLWGILVNDNSIQQMDNLFIAFGNELYNYIGMVVIPMVSFAYILVSEENTFIKIKQCLNAILIGIVCSMIFSLLSNYKGAFAGSPALLVNITVFYVPFLLINALQKDCSNRILSIVLGVVGVILAFYYSTMGKTLMLIFLIPFIILYYLLIKKNKIWFFFSMVFSSALAFKLADIVSNLTKTSYSFEWKLRQVRSLVMFWLPGWLENMPTSPRTRVEELINITLEYVNKPWYLIFGKGYMGTFTDRTGFINAKGFAGYSLAEGVNRAYYSVHETVNVLFLTNGVVGLLSILFIAFIALKNMRNSNFLLIGLVWFIFFYGWSLTLAVYGIACLLVGFTEIQYKKDRAITKVRA